MAIMYVYIPDRDQSSSLLCISSSINVGIVHHFYMVNHLNTVESRHVLTPSAYLHSPASSFPGWRKAGRRPGNEATHSSERTGEWNMACYWNPNAPTRAWRGRSVASWGQSVILWSSFADSIRQAGTSWKVYKTFDLPSLTPASIL